MEIRENLKYSESNVYNVSLDLVIDTSKVSNKYNVTIEYPNGSKEEMEHFTKFDALITFKYFVVVKDD